MCEGFRRHIQYTQITRFTTLVLMETVRGASRVTQPVISNVLGGTAGLDWLRGRMEGVWPNKAGGVCGTRKHDHFCVFYFDADIISKCG